MALSFGGDVKTKPNQKSLDSKLTKEADELAVALSKVTIELGKISGVFAAKALQQ